ncbi:Rho-type GTPase-activating protein 4 [Tolypocladium capitatum]|uniref:Rho-type GTPase-activating protein 4 n=1 Tax=Tolypocladium capitatum TaxID=45235 RepID=A0A2K3QER3_9HYPO|nr:Rho-type GTPase-activating protein 4 [Tolypocladium capitatum]
MATIVDEYLDSPLETDDVFPCKGCGEVRARRPASLCSTRGQKADMPTLCRSSRKVKRSNWLAGLAPIALPLPLMTYPDQLADTPFSTAGNRWHLDCFRCNTCDTLLDSDANLLLLGDGSLICNNCTYSCNACGNKIEDLAILTGDQAFCATCFRCRNCKRKIENLRYARTSQGIFCMGCHETLMARRRKKSKAAAAAKSREKDLSPMITDKSLPALPPSAVPSNSFANDRVDPDSDTPTELSPRPRPGHRHVESTSRGSSRPARSPERDPSSARPDGPSLPASTYRKNSESVAGESPNGGFFISVALDPSPGTHRTPTGSASDSAGDGPKRKKEDYSGVPKSTASEKRSDSIASTPHIAFQDKGRQASLDHDVAQAKPQSRKLSRSSEHHQIKTSSSADDFKLQDAPKARRDLASRKTSSPSSVPQDANSGKTPNGVSRKDGLPNLSDLKRANENTPPSRASQDSRWQDDDDMSSSYDASVKGTPRLDGSSKAITRKELPPAAPSRNSIYSPAQCMSSGLSLITSPTANGKTGSQTRPGPHEKKNTDTYMHPRAAPAPPGGQGLVGKESMGPRDEPASPKVSPELPRWSSGGDFTMDEDMARILGTDEGSSSILRRVSNAVRHGRTGSIESSYSPQRASHSRSISETTRAMTSPRWPKAPLGDGHNGHPDISNPVSLTSGDDPTMLKRQLRNSEQRVAELERQFNTENDLKNLNKKLIEKRKTVSVLDTQTEIMIRQLEVLAGYIERAKETKTPIDPRELEDAAIKEFVQKLDKVKLIMSASIEQLHEERNQLIEEKNQAVADRDRALMEFEQLSSKNAQLADMNNDLTHQIQGRFKSQIGGDMKSANGLGIYGYNKGATASSVNLDAVSVTTGATLIPDEEPIVESGPTVVQVRKGQVKKFNWKKGSKTMAQNVAKGVNRAVVAFSDRERVQHQGLVGDNIGLPYNMTTSQVESPAAAIGPNNSQSKQQLDGRQAFGFFGKKNALPKSMSASAMSAPAAAEPPSTLFGSELPERAEYERRQIPTVVTRCIEEVELRGMDQEGIYRKTGGNSQVNMVKDGFDRDDNFDISDPDLDITAVTSVLKQYFRKLPTPLLTFDVYERVLESNAIADEAERCDHLRKAFLSMPQSHSDCLEFLMFHLARVAQREPENLMSPKNLAVVFAPTIMRDLSIEREMTDMHAKNIAVQFVIENSHKIFADA